MPIGIGVHTGVAYVGRVGEGDACDFTAVGDAVNTTARLASSAGAGEILVSKAAADASMLDASGLESRTLTLRGQGRDDRRARPRGLAHDAAKRRSSSSTSSAQRSAFGSGTSFPHGERSAMPWSAPGTRT